MAWVVMTHQQSLGPRVFQYPIPRFVVYETSGWLGQIRKVLVAAVAVRGGVVSWQGRRHVWGQVEGF